MSKETPRRGRPRTKPDAWDKVLVEEINTIENEDFKKRLLALNLFRLAYKNARPRVSLKKRWARKYEKIQKDYENLIEEKNAADKARELSFELIILLGVELTRRVTKEELKAMINSLSLFPL